MPRIPHFDQIVFSGGGLRCFWHGGWMSAVESAARFDPRRVTGVSGGALSAAAWLADREAWLFERFGRALHRNDANVTWDDADDDHGRTPHQRVYKAIVDDVIDGPAQDRIADGPAFQISVATPTDAPAPDALQAGAAGLIYQAEQVVAPTPHPRLSAAAGMTRRLIDARRAARDGTLPDLIRMAATVPPAFRPDTWDDEPIYDGGMVDKAPRPEPDRGRTLVLLTKRFRTLPDDEGGRIDYVQPSDDVLSGGKLDFTDPTLLREAWDQGRRDGEAWLEDR
ncbi:patatin-like phospholipase family protein [Jannaschia sp. LMIT008]|uniref:patatin-like phospholipase family protein n=1 Tax=Jannaschia maritima TaxID=3032585 RepID=UPI0028118B31|nr:patatin-like phospholipase family protein [Jannaschia sp. LMIT008]